MANIKSSIKRVQTTKTRTMRNRSAYSAMQTAIKKFKAAIYNNDAEGAEKLLPATYAIIDSTASAGVIHKNNAARKKAQAAGLLRDLKSGKLVIAAKVDNKARAAEKARLKAEELAKAKEAAAEKAAAKAAEKSEKATKAKKGKALKMESEGDVVEKPKSKKKKKDEAEDTAEAAE